MSPQKYSFDGTSKKGSCCDAGQSYTFDPAANVGGCCTAPLTYQCQCAAAPVPPPPTTSNPSTAPKQCPQAQGWVFTQDGIDYEIDCVHGWAQYLGQGSWTKATDIWECLKNCGMCARVSLSEEHSR